MRDLLDHVALTLEALRTGSEPPPPDAIAARLTGIPRPPPTPSVAAERGRLRVALVRREYPPETAHGGIATFTFNLARGLSRSGHAVTVITAGTALVRRDHEGCVDVFQLDPRLEGAQDSLARLHERGWLDLGTLAFLHGIAALRAIRELEASHGRFDVLDLGDYAADGLAPALFHDRPTTVRLHTAWTLLTSILGTPGTGNDLLTIPIFESALLRRATLITAASLDVAERTRTYFELTAPIAHIPNPVDAGFFHPSGGAPDRRRVSFVGRLGEHKGTRTLFEAIPQVLARAPDVEFSLVGADPEGWAGRIPPSCATNVRVHDRLPRTALPAVYQDAAVVVQPSLYDNSPNVVLEAMACGTPVIVSDAGGTPEYVLDGTTGVVVPARDPGALADAILRLVTDAAARDAMGRAARAWIEETFSIEAMTPRFEQQYRAAVAGIRGATAMAAPVRVTLGARRRDLLRVDAIVLAGIDDGDGVDATIAAAMEQGAAVTLVWDGPIAPRSPGPGGRTTGSSGRAGSDAARVLAGLSGDAFFVLHAGDDLPPGWVERARQGFVESGLVAITVEGRRLLAARAAPGLLFGGARTWDEVLDIVAARPALRAGERVVAATHDREAR